jgi:hypothetical protein
MLVSLGLSLASWHFHLFRFVAQQAPAQVPRATIVYGTGLAHMNGQSEAMTCTAMDMQPFRRRRATRAAAAEHSAGLIADPA